LPPALIEKLRPFALPLSQARAQLGIVTP
jgi:hypothetical protein